MRNLKKREKALGCGGGATTNTAAGLGSAVGGSGGRHGRDAVDLSAMSGVVLGNSVGVALVTAVLATGLGTILAGAALGAGHGGRWTMVVAGIVALAMPSFFATAVWLSWFGLAGAGATDWTARVWSLGGTVAILVLLYWPVAFLLVLGAWSRVDAAQFEVEPRARGWWLVRWLMLPTGQSAMVTAGMIVLVLAMNNFTVAPALLLPQLEKHPPPFLPYMLKLFLIGHRLTISKCDVRKH